MRTIIKRAILYLSLIAAGALVGWGVNRMMWPHDTSFVGRTVTVSWGDGKYGPAFYGAWVHTEPSGRGFSVHLWVCIGPGNPMWYDVGELGWVPTHADAVRDWGKVTWREEGLYVGTGDYFVPRTKIESHR